VTRATLLHVLDQPTALGPAEVRELEQLAQAFPYCQTAHLLLAKAAHDQGTMLAGQRLRRAATYAADRTLLRRLIEQTEPAAVAEAPEAPAPTELPAPVELTIAAPIPAGHSDAAGGQGIGPDTFVASEAAAVPAIQPASIEFTGEPVPETAAELVTDSEPTVRAEPESSRTDASEPSEEPSGALLPLEALLVDLPVALEEQPQPSAEAVTAPAAVADLPPALEAPATETATTVVAEPAFQPEEALPESAKLDEAELPAAAPAIRPPVEVGEARFEFGLAEEAPPAAPTYELPGLVDEWAASAVTRGLGSPALLAETLAPTPLPAPAVAVTLTAAAFTGDDTLGYGFGESSRLGFSVQLLHLLAGTGAAECETAAAAAAQPPATPLPPTGAFFEPDPLLLSYWATHVPAPPVLPSSLDLINNFLRRQPRLTRPAMLPPAPAHQADLSVRSTRAEPDLASESLARIFVRQGKTARAIEIYEQLMVKQPEKMAYFAAQIQLLQPPA